MKETELMTGDLVQVSKDVCYKKGTIVKIHGIDADHVFPEKGLKGVASCMQVNDPDGCASCVWLDYLEPIPLTSEILEQNGFEVKVGPGGKYQLTIEGVSCRVDFNIIQYIHDLQHALRLCGIEKEIKLED